MIGQPIDECVPDATDLAARGRLLLPGHPLDNGLNELIVSVASDMGVQSCMEVVDCDITAALLRLRQGKGWMVLPASARVMSERSGLVTAPLPGIYGARLHLLYRPVTTAGFASLDLVRCDRSSGIAGLAASG